VTIEIGGIQFGPNAEALDKGEARIDWTCGRTAPRSASTFVDRPKTVLIPLRLS
jgi:hypothetical protein